MVVAATAAAIALMAIELGSYARQTTRTSATLIPGAVTVAAIVSPGMSRPPSARYGLEPDAAGRISVALADPVPRTLPRDGVPPGWTLKEFAGRSEVRLLRTEGRLAVMLRATRSSFVLHRDVALDVAEFPILTWSWKVLRVPAGGDVRQPHRDDQAAQLYAIFPRWPAPLTRSDVIGYVWDTSAPIGTRVVGTRAANLRVIVVESGRSQLGAWRSYERNLAQDYLALFGRNAPRLGKVALMIDANDTGSDAETLIGGLAFARSP